MIEDVEYLISNTEKDSQIVYIDSGLRDKYFYPNANDYVVNFDQPFKLVYGFDILDATVPVTMYNVDQYNNDMCITVVSKNPVTLTPIDPEYYFEELTTCASFVELFNKNVETYIAVGLEADLSPYLSNVLLEDKNFAMYYRKSISTLEIVTRVLQTEEEFFFFKFQNIEYAIRKSNDNHDIIDILQSGDFFIHNSSNGTELVYFEKHLINSTVFAAIKNANAFTITVSNYIKTLEVGNYDVITIINDLNDLLNPSLVDVESTTPAPKKQAKLLFSSSNFILINAARGELTKSLGFDTYPFATSSNYMYKGWNVGTNSLVFGGVYDTSTSKYKIISPGLISLLGERFAILRIKELEDHIYGSYSYMKMTPGIGMFKMAAAFGGITNLRFDYTTVIKKPFHPIGKLSRLSIRFETSSGRLYDFKGVNHQLMVNIKFYVPTQKMKFTKSILNPNYDPDVMQYMAKNRAIENREQSDDEQEFEDENKYLEYKKELDKYDYSTSDDEDEEEDEEDNRGDDSSEEDVSEYIEQNRVLFMRN